MIIVDPRWPTALRSLRQAAGLSYRGLGRQVAYSASYLCELEAGRKTPTVSVAEHLDAALGAGGRLAGLVVDDAAGLDGDQRSRLAIGDTSSAAVDALAVILAQHRRLEDTVGSAAVVDAAAAQLAAVERLAATAAGAGQAQLQHIYGQSAQLVGWLQMTLGQYGAARRTLAQAETAARAAGDVDLIALVVSFRGHLAELCGRPTEAAELSRAALAGGSKVYIGERVYDTLQLARAVAHVNDRRAATETIREADQLAAEFDVIGSDPPPWHYYRSAAFLTMERGLVHAIHASTDSRAADAAISDLTAGLAALPDVQRHAEWAGDYLLALADVHAAVGDQNASTHTLEEVQTVADATGSARLRRAVRKRPAND
ncbi:helix-turn-helix domain-containing protein [Solwaraspora sp. WMMB762]|uniref:helix-turn-helix domain-containing protein n=1 Tax=Solwaraspora sp. WMMB762 TaxID=3404120 RepID=UPI003B94B8AD